MTDNERRRPWQSAPTAEQTDTSLVLCCPAHLDVEQDEDEDECPDCLEVLKRLDVGPAFTCPECDNEVETCLIDECCPVCFVRTNGAGECHTCDHLYAAYEVRWAAEYRQHVVELGGCEIEGEECEHCTVCRRCKHQAKVCRRCHLCTDHERTSPECEVWRWNRALQREKAYYHHSLWSPGTEWSE